VIDWADSNDTGVVLIQHVEKQAECNSLDIEIIGMHGTDYSISYIEPRA